MNFLEAVQALKDGRCEAITNNCGDKLEYYGGRLIGSTSTVTTLVDAILATDWELVNPKPQTEVVEVVKWRCKYFNTDEWVYRDVAPNIGDYESVIVLRGSYTREVKPKVKRREEIEIPHGVYQLKQSREYNSVIPGSKFYREWEDAP